MKNHELKDLSKLLMLYEVPEPSPELLFETKRLMREEFERLAEVPSWQNGWIIMLVGLAMVITMGLFYTFTIGTVLSFAFPSDFTLLLQYSLYAFAAVGGILIAGVSMVFYFKQYQMQQIPAY